MKVTFMDSWVDIRIADVGAKLLANYYFAVSDKSGRVWNFRVPFEKWSAWYDGSTIPPILSIPLGQRLDSHNAKCGTVHDAAWDGMLEIQVGGLWIPIWFSPAEADEFYASAQEFLGYKRSGPWYWAGVRLASLWDTAKGWMRTHGPLWLAEHLRDDPEYMPYEAWREVYPEGVRLDADML